MKKFYEAPVAEELYANAPALMTDDIAGSGNEDVVSGSDESGQDLSWGLLGNN